LKGVPANKANGTEATKPVIGSAVAHEQKGQSSKGVVTSGKSAVLPFTKMQALGNDFVVVSEQELSACLSECGLPGPWQEQSAGLARLLCDRHFGVGADGLIVARAAQRVDCELSWLYTNSDGSPAVMCGNGLRCLALWAVNRQVVKPPAFAIETAIGPVAVQFRGQDEIEIDLGEPILGSERIPVHGQPRQPVLKEKLPVGTPPLTASCVSMGNPHCVIFEPDASEDQLASLAAEIQAAPFFPEGVNVEFAFAERTNLVRVLVWERGCGATLACASGAAATVVAGVLEDRLERTSEVKLPGGSLSVTWSAENNRVSLSGPARESFSGTIDLSALLAETAAR
jgi:diaminopimelate epimerase